MDDDVRTPRLGVLGGGVMGETVVAAALRAGWSDEDVRVTERSAVRANELSERYGVRAADGSDVKPTVVPVDTAQIAGVLGLGAA